MSLSGGSVDNREEILPPEPALRVSLLGTPEISLAGHRLQLPATRKALALLAYLILNRSKPQPRDRLVYLFWSERPEEKARSSLSTAIWHVSRCLPSKGNLLSGVQTVQFNPRMALWLDVDQFERGITQADLPDLQAALALYRGDFLEGSYEEWILHERYRLENLFLDGLARWMQGNEAAGDYRIALAAAQRLLSYDPLREDACQTAMRLCAGLGRRGAAQEYYQRCCEALRSELNTLPLPETSQVYQAILDGRFTPPAFPVQRSEPSPVIIAQTPTGQNPLISNLPPPFLGREAELAALEHLWQRARSGQGSLVIISGEAGVGKTRLVEEFASRLGWSGVQVLHGRCYEFEHILPYQPVAEALRSAGEILKHMSQDRSQAWILQEISRLAPELAMQAAALGPSPSDQDQGRLFEAVACFTQEIARPNGLLIVVEDLHWAAESTLELLHYLVRRLRAQPILLVCTLRPEELGRSHPFRPFRESLRREGLAQEICLDRLGLRPVIDILQVISGWSGEIVPLAERLYQETEGNPFFLMEVVKALFENSSLRLDQGRWQGDFDQISDGQFPLPADLSEAIHNRFYRLAEDAQQAACMAAVIGREFDFRLLRDACSWSDEQTLEALEDLLRRRLVDEGSGRTSRDYTFTHHKIQEVIYAGLSQRRRWLAHARIGGLIEKACEPDVGETAGELAHHFYQARSLSLDLTGKAITYLLMAGDRARVLYAHKEASGYYLQALDILQGQGETERTARVNMKLGVTYHNAFRYQQAHQAFEEGFRLWQKTAQVERVDLTPAPHPLRANWLPITSIDPTYAIDLPGVVAVQLFSALVSFSVDMEILPDIADKWELAAGGREYVFHLQERAAWSDGRPLTAHDFVYSGRRILTPANRSPLANLLYDIQGARAYNLGQSDQLDAIGLRALDPRTLLIQLEEPAPYFLQLLANFLAVPGQSIETYGERWTEPAHLATSGPFRLSSWEKGSRMELSRNPHYHGVFSGNLEEVVLDLQPDFEQQLELYLQDQLDVLEMKSCPGTTIKKAAERMAGEYFSFPAAFIHLVGFDTRRPPFDDPRVRQAFCLAVDKEMLASRVLKGAAFPASGGFMPPGLPGHSPGIALPFDPERARALLAQAGYARGRGFSDIQALSLFQTDDPLNRYLVDQWREVLGVEVHWEQISPGLHLLLESRPPNLFLSQWWGDYPDPDDFLGASQIRRWTGWQDETFQTLLRQTRFTPDQADRLKLFQQADFVLVQSAPILPLTYNRQHFLLKPWVKRYPVCALFSWFWKDVVIAPH